MLELASIFTERPFFEITIDIVLELQMVEVSHIGRRAQSGSVVPFVSDGVERPVGLGEHLAYLEATEEHTP